jgi:hypothetical protein
MSIGIVNVEKDVENKYIRFETNSRNIINENIIRNDRKNKSLL